MFSWKGNWVCVAHVPSTATSTELISIIILKPEKQLIFSKLEFRSVERVEIKSRSIYIYSFEIHSQILSLSSSSSFLFPIHRVWIMSFFPFVLVMTTQWMTEIIQFEKQPLLVFVYMCCGYMRVSVSILNFGRNGTNQLNKRNKKWYPAEREREGDTRRMRMKWQT